eukprot:1477134-Pleurochrysis_carterae.AAC.1
MERPGITGRRSRRRRRLVTLGRVVNGRRRRWQRGRRLGQEFIVERAAHAVARDLRGPRDRGLRAGAPLHRRTQAFGGGGGEGLSGSKACFRSGSLESQVCESATAGRQEHDTMRASAARARGRQCGLAIWRDDG